jgi:DNA-binding response OmpR family regulator
MKVFITKANEVLTREELLENLWDQSDFVDDNTLTVNITRLRSKLSELGYDDCIKTKRGVGYVFDI